MILKKLKLILKNVYNNVDLRKIENSEGFKN